MWISQLGRIKVRYMVILCIKGNEASDCGVCGGDNMVEMKRGLHAVFLHCHRQAHCF